MSSKGCKKARAVFIAIVIAQLALGPDAAAIESFNVWETMKSVTESVSKGFKKILGKRVENLKIKEKDYVTYEEATGKIPGSPNLDFREKEDAAKLPDPLIGKASVVSYSLDPENGDLRQLTFNGDVLKKLSLPEFFEKFAGDLGLDADRFEWTETASLVTPSFSGASLKTVRYRAGLKPASGGGAVPVHGAELIVTSDKLGIVHVYCTVPAHLAASFPQDQDLVPSIGADQAVKKAKTELYAWNPSYDGRRVYDIQDIRDAVDDHPLDVEVSAKTQDLFKKWKSETDDGESPENEGSSEDGPSDETSPEATIPLVEGERPEPYLTIVTTGDSRSAKDARLAWAVAKEDGDGRPVTVFVIANGANGGKAGKVAVVQKDSFDDIDLGDNSWTKGVNLCMDDVETPYLVVSRVAPTNEYLFRNYAHSVGMPSLQDAKPDMPSRAIVSVPLTEKLLKVYSLASSEGPVLGTPSKDGDTKKKTRTAVSLLRGIQASIQFYFEKFKAPDGQKGQKGWKGIEGFGKIHPNAVLVPASEAFKRFALPSTGQMYFAEESTGERNVCLNSVGHEVSHLLFSNVVRPKATGYSEVDAVHEGFATVFGVLIKAYAKNSPIDWKYDGVLDLQYPKDKGFADTYEGYNFVSKKNCGDAGGLCYRHVDDPSLGVMINQCTDKTGFCDLRHRNSTVIGKWFSLLAQSPGVTTKGANDVPLDKPAGEKRKYEVTAIGPEDASQIAFETIQKLPATATFEDVRNVSINVARVRFGATSQQVRSVRQAWRAVNVGPSMERMVLPANGRKDVAPWGAEGSAEKGVYFSVQLAEDEPAQIEAEIATDENFTAKVGGFNSCQVTEYAAIEDVSGTDPYCVNVLPLMPNTRYFWRYRVDKNADWEETRTFVTAAYLPEITSHGSGAMVQPWKKFNVSWKPVPNAESYTVVIHQEKIETGHPAGKVDHFEVALPGTSRDKTFAYSLSVKAIGPGGLAAEGLPVNITLDYAATKPQGIVSPPQVTFGTKGVVLDWADIPGAAKYVFETTSNHSGQTQLIPVGAESSQFVYTNFVSIKGLCWRVWGVGTAGDEGDKSDKVCIDTILPSISPFLPDQGGVWAYEPPTTFFMWASPYAFTSPLLWVQETSGPNVCPTLSIPAGSTVPPGLKGFVATGFKNDLGDGNIVGGGAWGEIEALPPNRSYCWAVVGTQKYDDGKEFVIAHSQPRGFSVVEKKKEEPKPEPAKQCTTLAAPQVIATGSWVGSTPEGIPGYRTDVSLAWNAVPGAKRYKINYVTAANSSALGGLIQSANVSGMASLPWDFTNILFFSQVPPPGYQVGYMVTVQAENECGQFSSPSVPVGFWVVP